MNGTQSNTLQRKSLEVSLVSFQTAEGSEQYRIFCYLYGFPIFPSVLASDPVLAVPWVVLVFNSIWARSGSGVVANGINKPLLDNSWFGTKTLFGGDHSVIATVSTVPSYL